MTMFYDVLKQEAIQTYDTMLDYDLYEFTIIQLRHNSVLNQLRSTLKSILLVEYCVQDLITDQLYIIS